MKQELKVNPIEERIRFFKDLISQIDSQMIHI